MQPVIILLLQNFIISYLLSIFSCESPFTDSNFNKTPLKIVLAIMNSVTQTYFNYLISENWLLNMIFITEQVNFNVKVTSNILLVTYLRE